MGNDKGKSKTTDDTVPLACSADFFPPKRGTKVGARRRTHRAGQQVAERAQVVIFLCESRVAAVVLLSCDVRWRWCAVTTATNRNTGPELTLRVGVDEVGRGNEFARPGKDTCKWRGNLRNDLVARRKAPRSRGGYTLGDECGVPRGLPASGASGIRWILQGPGVLVCYARAGKHGVRKVGARRRTHCGAWLIRGPLWQLREERHGLTRCTRVWNGSPRSQSQRVVVGR